MTANIQKWGNSQGIRIPKAVLEEIHWNTDEEVEIEVCGDAILIKKSTPGYPVIDLEKKFAEYNGEIPSGEIDWGDPQGEEIW